MFGTSNLLAEKVQCELLTRNNPSLTIYYEDLFDKQASTVQRIMDFLGIEDPRFEHRKL